MRALETTAVETEDQEIGGYTIEDHEDVNEASKAHQEEVSRGDDYEEQLGPD